MDKIHYTEPTELSLQRDIFVEVWNKWPETRYKFFHIVNEGKRSVMLNSQLKASGMLPGLPDMCLVWAGMVFFFELKTDQGHVSHWQRVEHSAFAQEGILVFIIRDKKHAFEIIDFIMTEWNTGNFYSLLYKRFGLHVSMYADPNMLDTFVAIATIQKNKKYVRKLR